VAESAPSSATGRVVAGILVDGDLFAADVESVPASLSCRGTDTTQL
jgi:hypothetical protein